LYLTFVEGIIFHDRRTSFLIATSNCCCIILQSIIHMRFFDLICCPIYIYINIYSECFNGTHSSKICEERLRSHDYWVLANFSMCKLNCCIRLRCKALIVSHRRAQSMYKFVRNLGGLTKWEEVRLISHALIAALH